jgi:putative transposase
MTRYIKYLTTNTQLSQLAASLNLSLHTIQRKFKQCREILPEVLSGFCNSDDFLVLDATSILSRKLVVLIARTRRGVIAYRFAPVENHESWLMLLNSIKGTPKAIICDGQKGMKTAIFRRFGTIPIQRCFVHIVRQAKAKLTRNPQTLSGKELRVLVCALTNIRTRPDADLWKSALQEWCMKHSQFLKEKSYGTVNPNRVWYTHRKLRGVRSLLVNSSTYMFTYLTDPDIPRDTNFLEGGINSPLKALFKNHRGMSLQTKITLTAWYLTKRKG